MNSSFSTPRKYLATTPGLSATRWLCFALKLNSDVFVAHGKHPLSSIMTSDVEDEYQASDEASFSEGNLAADVYNDGTLEELFEQFHALKPDAAAIGNVHGFTLRHLQEKKPSQKMLDELSIINVLRHPVRYLASHTALIKKAIGYEYLRKAYMETQWDAALASYPELHLFDNIPKEQLVPFAVSCLSVSDMQYGLDFVDCKHMQMEQLTTDVASLKRFCESLTGLTYDDRLLQQHIDSGAINKHQSDERRFDPQAIFASWEPWQQDMAQMLTPLPVLRHFHEHGYDMSMLSFAPMDDVLAVPEETIAYSAQAYVPSVESPDYCFATRNDSAADSFAGGNYVQAIFSGEKDTWEYYAALGIIGKTEQCLKGLESFEHQDATFYKGVACWIAGDDDAARAYLQQVDSEHARNLLDLINKPKISVLAQLPWLRVGGSDYLNHLTDDKFAVKQFSFHEKDIQNTPYADIFSYVDETEPPDFYVANMVEWHAIPRNVQDLPCPILGHTADYDLHIQKAYPWLQLFDCLVVTDHTEYGHLKGFMEQDIYTFPKTFGLADAELEQIEREEKNIDITITGSLLHPYHPDKVSMLMQALETQENREPYILDGFTSFEDYSKKLARTKCTITSVRHSGAMPTRGLEALSHGCAVAVQEHSVLSLYAGEEEGVFPYKTGDSSLKSVLGRILENWDTVEEQAQKGAQIIRDELALSVVTSQYLRFLTFLAARPQQERKRVPQETLFQGRSVLKKGFLPPTIDAIRAQTAANVKQMAGALSKDPSPRQFIDLSRELSLGYIGLLDYANTKKLFSQEITNEVTGMQQDSFRVFMEGVKAYPGSLPLAFNLIRMTLHYGGADVVRFGIKLAKDVLAHSPDHWKVDVMEDVFPWDFFSASFDYRSYFDEVCQQLPKQYADSPKLAKLIYAALYYYLSHYQDGILHCCKAVEMNPAFAPYRYRLARLYLEKGDAESIAKAGDLLVGLCSDSYLFERAFASLQRLHFAGKYPVKDFDRLKHRVNHMQHGGFIAQREGMHVRCDKQFEINLQPEYETAL